MTLKILRKLRGRHLKGIYESIYGAPDENGRATIERASRERWAPDQFGAYLRAQPRYTASQDCHAKALALLDLLGLRDHAEAPGLALPLEPSPSSPQLHKQKRLTP